GVDLAHDRRHLRRLRPEEEVAAEDDRVDVLALDLCEHGFEGRGDAVDVVQRGDAQAIRGSRARRGGATGPRLRGRSPRPPPRSGPAGRSPCRRRPWRRAAGGWSRLRAAPPRPPPRPVRRRAAARGARAAQPPTFAFFSNRATVFDGVAPLDSHSLTLSSSKSI